MARKRPELNKSETVAELPKACASEVAAVEFFERKRWGGTPCCVHCGSVGVYQMTDRKTGERNKRFLWRCRDCGKQSTVRTGTIFEESLIPLHKWARAFWQAASNKNGGSAIELARQIQVTHKTALFMLHRIRWAMADGNGPKLGGTIEADETYVGGKPRKRIRGGFGNKAPKVPVFAVVQRGGDVRACIMPNVTAYNVREALDGIADLSAKLMTDESPVYRRIGEPFASHGRVNHSKWEYVSATNPDIHTNTIEGFFSRVKRQLESTYYAVSKEHLHRYIAQAAFLYNPRRMKDGERIDHLIRRADGKRLYFRDAVA